MPASPGGPGMASWLPSSRWILMSRALEEPRDVRSAWLGYFASA
jgi:hypothetical protein